MDIGSRVRVAQKTGFHWCASTMDDTVGQVGTVVQTDVCHGYMVAFDDPELHAMSAGKRGWWYIKEALELAPEELVTADNTLEA